MHGKGSFAELENSHKKKCVLINSNTEAILKT